jgi:hypothetical protein
MSVWGDAKMWMRRYDDYGVFSSHCDAGNDPNGEILHAGTRLIGLNGARCARIEKKVVLQGLGGCLEVVSGRHGHVSAPVSGVDQTPQGWCRETDDRLTDIECLEPNAIVCRAQSL